LNILYFVDNFPAVFIKKSLTINGNLWYIIDIISRILTERIGQNEEKLKRKNLKKRGGEELL